MAKDTNNTDNSFEVSIPVEYVSSDYDDVEIQQYEEEITSDTDIEFE